MKFLITGATGFIGTNLVNKLLSDGHEIVILTRGNKKYNPAVTAVNSVNSIPDNQKIDVMINLAGAPIDRIWTKKYKKKLVESRISVTIDLVKLTSRLSIKPKLLISCSAIGYYGVSKTSKVVVNEKSICDKSFTHELCEIWEEKAQEIQNYGVRICIARLGVVLGKSGGIIKKMFPMVKYGLGSIIGNGHQYISWVALEDVIKAFDYFIENPSANGAYNITAINPVTNAEFTKIFANSLQKKVRLTIPAFFIKLFFGQMGRELLLNGKYIFPQKLQDSGFKFTYPNLQYYFKTFLDNN
ncbi:MAG: TIGR01777 family protein [Legionellales bacterium]|nr:TIGR01777 family protein [Legionellales bacterium]